MRSPEAAAESELERLTAIAAAAVHHGLRHARAPDIDTASLPATLSVPGASFVTLEHSGGLRGCIGSLEARRALAQDVAANAFAAAFHDPRFAPLAPAEIELTTIKVSVLSAPRAFECPDADALHAELRPDVDGLILAHRDRRATFLPDVWAALPEPARFVAELRRKAGIADTVPVAELALWRYTTRHGAATPLAVAAVHIA